MWEGCSDTRDHGDWFSGSAGEILALRDAMDSEFMWMQPMVVTSRLRQIWPAPAKQSFAKVGQADSIVIDPQNTVCNPTDAVACCSATLPFGKLYKHESPLYLFQFRELHLGEISMECSVRGRLRLHFGRRQKLLPLVPAGNLPKV